MTDHRARCYTLLQIGKKQLGMDNETYRLLLAKHGAKEKDGKVSATTMAIGALMQAVESMKRLGFKPKAKRGSAAAVADWRAPRIEKITALWCTLADAGVVRERGEAAMVKWCAGITRKARLQWASSADLNACIEALKSWARREKVACDEQGRSSVAGGRMPGATDG